MSAKEVYEASHGLQHDAQRRKEFNDWSQQFQRSPEAWAVTGEVLQSSEAPRELKIFCAQTSRNKAAYDSHQVPTEARVTSKNQVIDSLEINRDLSNVVGVQLCIALAAFAMQMLEWVDPVQEMIQKLDSPEMVPLLFEFLKVLPEEFHSKRSGLVNHAVVSERSTQLIQNNAYMVMEFISNRAELMAQKSDHKASFFGASNPWLQEVQLTDIMASPLVPWMISSFEDEEARAPAIDCLIIVLKETSDIYETTVQDAIKHLYPEIMKSAQTYIPKLEEDQDMNREVTRLLSEAASAWHVSICRDPNNFFPSLEAVAQCSFVPDAELSTSELTFKFFQSINSTIGEPSPSMDTPSSVHNQTNEAAPLETARTSTSSFAADSRQSFRPLFIKLLGTFVRRLELPTAFENADEEEMFRDFRYEIGNMLKVCSGIAGHEEVLKWFHENIGSQNAAGGTASCIEASLFGFRSIARTVPPKEDMWMPKSFDTIFRVPFLDTETVQHAAILLLGRYSQWATFHPEYLHAFLDHIIQSAWSPFAEVRRASAHAFLYSCSDASFELAEWSSQIIEFYSKSSGQPSIELESSLNYSDGVGFVLNNLQEPVMAQAIQILFGAATERTQSLMAKAEAAGISKQNGNTAASSPEFNQTAMQVGHDLQGLGSIVGQIGVFKYENEINMKHPLYLAVMNSNALFTSLLRDYGPVSTEIAESIAKYYIKVLFNVTGGFQRDLPSSLEAVHKVLVANPSLPVLYELSSTISQCYSAYVEPNATIDHAIWLFLQQTCSVSFEPEVSKLIEKDGEKEPEDSPIIQLVYQGFHLLCDVATYFPGPFLDSSLEQSVILSAHVLRFCYDIDCLTSIGHFYDDLKSLVTSAGEPQLPPNVVEKIKQGLGNSGSHLLRAFFYWFMIKPDSYFEPRAEQIVDFVFQMVPQSALEWLNTILAESPAGTTNEQEVTQFLGQVFQDTTNLHSRGVGMDMNRFIQAYAARNYDPRF